jgi:hypothetical protein
MLLIRSDEQGISIMSSNERSLQLPQKRREASARSDMPQSDRALKSPKIGWFLPSRLIMCLRVEKGRMERNGASGFQLQSLCDDDNRCFWQVRRQYGQVMPHTLIDAVAARIACFCSASQRA